MDRDFLFGVIAVQLGQATSAQVMAAASAYVADKSRSISERLLAEGVLTPERHKMLGAMVDDAIKAHGGDVAKTAETMGGQQAVFASFGGALAVDDQGALSIVPPSEGQADSIENVVAVTPEVPGRYRFGEQPEAGRGGIGRVLVAFDQHIGREIAVKELLADATGSGACAPSNERMSRTAALAARFLREARVTGQLEHPNIVPVYEVGKRPSGAYYYAMKLVRGRTLSVALRAGKSLGGRLKLLHHYLDLANAVAYAHSRGVVHRDLKPDNVMLGEFGETVVLDWGLAKVKGTRDVGGKELARDLKLLHDAAGSQTLDGSAIGTPAYMSPEQADGAIDDIDERSDVWSLGAVLYEILTGKPPFEGTTPFEIIGKVLKEPVRPPRERNEAIPAELSAIAMKALERDKAQRYGSAAKLAADIEAYMAGGRISAYVYSSWELVRRFVARNKALSLGVATALTAILVGAALVFLAWGREQHARAAAEEARVAAEVQKREAASNLAQAYLNKAEQLERDRNFGGAYLYSAAALREYQRLGQGVPADKRVALDSVLYVAKVRRTLALEQTLSGPDSDVRLIALSADGRLLGLCDSRQQLWLYALDGSRPPVKQVAAGYPAVLRFTTDGQELMVGDRDGLRWLSADDLHETRREALGAVFAIPPSDSSRVVVYKEGSTSLLDRGGSRPAVVLGPTSWLAWSHDATLLARTTRTGVLVIHDGATGAERMSIKVSDGPASSCAFSADDSRVLANTLGGMVVVDLKDQSIAARLVRAFAAVHSIDVAPDGRGWIFADDSGVVRWDGAGAALTETLWEPSRFTVAAVSQDRRRVVTAQQQVVRIWAVRTTERAIDVPCDAVPVSVAYAPDGHRVVFATAKGTVGVADFASGARSVVGQQAAGYFTRVSFSPDGRHIASVGSDQIVKVYDSQSAAEVRSGPLTRQAWPPNYSSSVAYSADGARLAVTVPDGRVHLLASGSLELERILNVYMVWPRTLRFSADGRWLLTGGALGSVAWWDTNDWHLVRATYSDEAGEISDAAMMPDGQTIVVAGVDGWVRRFSSVTADLTDSRRAHDAWVNQLALSADGSFMLTGSDDHTAKLWDARSGELVRRLAFDAQVGPVAFAPHGATFVTGSPGELVVFPDLRDLLHEDGNELSEDASRSTGLALVGFSMGPAGEAPAPSEPAHAAPAAPRPNELRARVVSWLASDKALPDATTVELLDEQRHEPFSPARVGRPDKSGVVSLLLPDGVDRVAARVSLGGETSYSSGPELHRGATNVFFTHVGADDAATLAAAAGIKIAPGTGHFFGALWWGAPTDLHTWLPAGCATVTEQGGARAFFAAVAASTRVNPDPRLEMLSPGAPWFYLFNLAPGEHVLTMRLGDAVLEAKVLIHAGSVTRQALVFPSERFSEDPTPKRCLEDWPPADAKTAAPGAARKAR